MMRLRQMALVAQDLDSVVEPLCDVLGLEVCFHDPGVGGFGLHNSLMAIGDTFLEVVAPQAEGTTAGRLLEKRGGDGGYMVLVQVDDLDKERARVESLGVRVVWNADLDDARGAHFHPRDVGAAILSFDQMMPPESWRWGGPDWRDHVKTDVITEIIGAELQSLDAGALASRWAEVFDVPREDLGDGRFKITVNGGYIRFVPETDGRGDGVSGVILNAVDAKHCFSRAEALGLPIRDNGVEIGGCWFYFES